MFLDVFWVEVGDVLIDELVFFEAEQGCAGGVDFYYFALRGLLEGD